MALALKVPTMVCDGCVKTVKEAIQTVDADAKVEIDLPSKQVTVESQASESSIKQAITATGHEIAGN